MKLLAMVPWRAAWMHILRANAGRKGSLDELSCVFKKYIESQILLDSKIVKSDKTGYYFLD